VTSIPVLLPALLDWSAYVRVALSQTRPDRGRRLGQGSLRTFEDAVRENRLHASPPFRVEALYSARTAAEFSAFSEELDGFAQARGDADTWLLAERAQRELAEDPAANHRISFPDLLIASIASQHRLAVLHYDSDYDLLAEHTSLEFESVWIAPPGSID
jgi:predicted nucleic acid-binding protein